MSTVGAIDLRWPLRVRTLGVLIDIKYEYKYENHQEINTTFSTSPITLLADSELDKNRTAAQEPFRGLRPNGWRRVLTNPSIHSVVEACACTLQGGTITTSSILLRKVHSVGQGSNVHVADKTRKWGYVSKGHSKYDARCSTLQLQTIAIDFDLPTIINDRIMGYKYCKWMVRTVESIDSRNVDIYMGRWKKYMEDDVPVGYRIPGQRSYFWVVPIYSIAEDIV
ncbi:uncharacterized protein F5891DRAFT_977557 [Suillus fuscotomentosus]|uniref:Uncharacterized protein n=1 Tax=Suillus fuscotomentosus TaxID=1912939 RepID=A0AAD4EDC5_9AGAM|nr:uncharacterized protein F5891DRAFT_977557 [Suillus fuscotomentosus]KAG1904055.1 hypothetical protein F5891DRAFT_977557 [Suillus fuscotomentosus]